VPPSPEREALDAATVSCPTCRAVQEWSDTCRRCRCDLRLLQDLFASYEQCRRTCLRHLHDGHPRLAWQAARRCHALAASPETLRLMAVSALRAGDLATAAALGRQS